MYVVTASLYFLVFVALKQVQAAVKGTQVRTVLAIWSTQCGHMHHQTHTAHNQGV